MDAATLSTCSRYPAAGTRTVPLSHPGWKPSPASHPPLWSREKTESGTLLMFERVLHHLDGLLAVHGRYHEAVVERAKRSQPVYRLCFVVRAFGFPQHAFGNRHRHVPYSHRTTEPAHRFLFT